MAHILILSYDVIGACMISTGIRYWEMTRTLAHEHAVVLITWLGATALIRRTLSRQGYAYSSYSTCTPARSRPAHSLRAQ